tara:strand:- start:774 stop:1013 length:240 start_codon:yes stop_codon:yes gene_type:complete
VIQDAICLALIAAFMAWEAERYKPKPYPVGNGDTLMVRIAGYGFCPKNCNINHFHIGHKENYNCETKICGHIVYEDRLR